MRLRKHDRKPRSGRSEASLRTTAGARGSQDHGRPERGFMDELNARLNLYPMPRNVVRMPQANVDLLERARAFRGKRG